jgi:hypothetical protein
VHPDFAKWPSIQRLSSETCYVTEKIDGTNGVIYVPAEPDKPVLAGSRERWLTNPDGTPPAKAADNFEFAAWVHERADALRALGPGYHYGEFHGRGIQRNYDLKDRRWASFEYWRDDIFIDGVCVVPVLYTGEPRVNVELAAMPWDVCVDLLRRNGSNLYPGFTKPEGVVITFQHMKSAKFKRLLDNDKLHKHQQGNTHA